MKVTATLEILDFQFLISQTQHWYNATYPPARVCVRKRLSPQNPKRQEQCRETSLHSVAPPRRPPPAGMCARLSRANPPPRGAGGPVKREKYKYLRRWLIRNIFKKDIRRLSNTDNLNATKFAGFRQKFLLPLSMLESKPAKLWFCFCLSLLLVCAQLTLCI